jgi:hypothetical protein
MNAVADVSATLINGQKVRSRMATSSHGRSRTVAFRILK